MLDLAVHYEDVVRIVYADFGNQVDDPDDLVHDVCLKILKLNAGSSPYDPERAKPSTYIHMVAQGVLLKGVRKQPEPSECDEYRRKVKTEEFFEDWNSELLKGFDRYLKETLEYEDVLPRRVYLLLQMGYTRQEICDLLDESLYQVKKQKSRLFDLITHFVDRRSSR